MQQEALSPHNPAKFSGLEDSAVRQGSWEPWKTLASLSIPIRRFIDEIAPPGAILSISPSFFLPSFPFGLFGYVSFWVWFLPSLSVLFCPFFQSAHFIIVFQRSQRSHKNCTILKATKFRKIMGAQGFWLHFGIVNFCRKFGSRGWWCWLVLWGFYRSFNLDYLLERGQVEKTNLPYKK